MKQDAFCGDLRYTTAINTIAAAIATQFESAEEQALVAAVLTQIADTVAVIAAKNVVCESKSKAES